VNEDDRIDTLIDEVAQAMTSAPPAGDDFARKVSMRIAEAGKRRASWFRPWVLVPLAAAILFIVLVRLKPDTTGIHPQPVATPPAVARVDSPAPPVTAVAAPRTAPAAIARIQPVAMAPIEIDPIAIEPLVETNAVQITPIAIDRIDISPMP